MEHESTTPVYVSEREDLVVTVPETEVVVTTLPSGNPNPTGAYDVTVPETWAPETDSDP